MRLENRVAFVTGASRGVGRAVALALAREGADLVLAAKTVEEDPRLPGTLPEVAREVEALGRRALVTGTDVRFEDQILAAVAKAKETFGRIDILINNAGALFMAPLADTPTKRFDLVVGINARAPFILCREVLPGMIARGFGHIVNMSPPLDPGMAKGKVPYTISKLGMTLITMGLAEEVRGTGVAVHSLWPVCAVESQATVHFNLGDRAHWRTPEILADATLALVTRDPSVSSGHAWLDEEILREVGTSDFSRYSVDPAVQPLRLDLFF